MKEEIKKALEYAASSNALENNKPTKEELKSIRNEIEKDIKKNEQKLIEEIRLKMEEKDGKTR